MIGSDRRGDEEEGQTTRGIVPDERGGMRSEREEEGWRDTIGKVRRETYGEKKKVMRE